MSKIKDLSKKVYVVTNPMFEIPMKKRREWKILENHDKDKRLNHEN